MLVGFVGLVVVIQKVYNNNKARLSVDLFSSKFDILCVALSIHSDAAV